MHRRYGFTLIELLVVIAVIVILIGILVPSLNMARSKARTIMCQTQLHQWGLLFNVLANDNDGRLMDRGDWESCRTQQFAYYIDTYHYPTFCPSAKKVASTNGIGSATQGWYCVKHTYRKGSYGLNGYSPAYNQVGRSIMPGYVPDNQSQQSASSIQGWKNINQKGARNIPVMLDSAIWAAFPKYTDEPSKTENQLTAQSYGNSNGYGMAYFSINRHNGSVNSLFLDWSVRKIGIKELWTLKWSPDFNTGGVWTLAAGVKEDSWPSWMRTFRDY
jgi:prepilin-type N-terminal cleavage/methylation domain-containing protein/prepilin-type processing-associated H-X9-DG protein